VPDRPDVAMRLRAGEFLFGHQTLRFVRVGPKALCQAYFA
jgi:hypothetical protein